MSRERPILFRGGMVRAILDGRKTQTRRPMVPQPYSNGFHYDPELRDIHCHNDYLPPSAMLLDVGRGRNRYTTSNLEEDWTRHCPFGLEGDRLWVRETWADKNPLYIDADGDMHRASQHQFMVHYRAGSEQLKGELPASELKWLDKYADAVTLLMIQELLSESEARKARQRIVKRVEKLLRGRGKVAANG